MSLKINNNTSKKSSKVSKMTVARLRTFKGFENYTDTKAKAILYELEKYAKIIVQHMMTTPK